MIPVFFLLMGCNKNTLKTNNEADDQNLAYIGYLSHQLVDDNFNVAIELTNMSNHSYKVAYLNIFFYDEDNNLTKEDKITIDKDIAPLENADINFTVANSVTGKIVDFKYYDENDQELTLKTFTETNIVSFMNNVDYSQDDKTITFDLTPDSDYQFTYLKLINQDNSNKMTAYKVYKIDSYIKANETQNIHLDYDGEPLYITSYTGLNDN